MSCDIIKIVNQISGNIDNLQIYFDPPIEPRQDGEFKPWSNLSLHPNVSNFFQSKFTKGLFLHQFLAIQDILQGHHTVVTTRTSSGKSLIYSIPILNSLYEDNNTTALLIYPQKALANDQLQTFETTLGSLFKDGDTNLWASRYDGGTPQENRPDIRNNVRVLLTNPDMLHLGILQYHDKHWNRFFDNLRFVVIDEAHEYRGIFGSNVAYVLRRLRQICSLHGTTPTFISTSATTMDPVGHLNTLTGLEFASIGADQDGSIQGRKKFWIMGSREEHYYDVASEIVKQLVESDLSTLIFCPSRVTTERLIARWNRGKKEDDPRVRVYRAGLKAEERETIEKGLKDGSIKAVFSTSALELGIDIGTLDIVVCVGLPNTMMSLRQRAGRVARSGKDGGIILIPGESPIESYYANYPEELFAREYEPLVVDLMNRRVVFQHYACAVKEAIAEEKIDTSILGETMEKVRQAREKGSLDDQVFYLSEPHSQIAIRSMGDGQYELKYRGETIGEIDSFHLLREAPNKGIYRHGGRPYRVKNIISGNKIVVIEPERSVNETTSLINKKVKLKRVQKIKKYDGLSIAQVNIDVTEYLIQVTEKNPRGETVNRWGGSGMRPHVLPTEGVEITIGRNLWKVAKRNLPYTIDKSPLYSAERLLRSLFPIISGPCDQQDFSSHTEIVNNEAHIYLYDEVYYGVGLTFNAYEKMKSLIEKSLQRLHQCECVEDTGCFKCIANPQQEEPASKQATRQLLSLLLDALETSTGKESIFSSPMDELVSVEEEIYCPACKSLVSENDRFCKNCGEKLIE